MDTSETLYVFDRCGIRCGVAAAPIDETLYSPGRLP